VVLVIEHTEVLVIEHTVVLVIEHTVVLVIEHTTYVVVVSLYCEAINVLLPKHISTRTF